jgi:hypothetical protein
MRWRADRPEAVGGARGRRAAAPFAVDHRDIGGIPGGYEPADEGKEPIVFPLLLTPFVGILDEGPSARGGCWCD